MSERRRNRSPRHRHIESRIRLDALNKQLRKYGSDIRAISLILHLHIEYWVNEILSTRLDNAQIVLEDYNGLGTFGNKVKLLNALGIIHESSDLSHNIQHVQRIRNLYAHNLIIEEINDEIKREIEGMKALHERTDDLTSRPLEDKFVLLGLETMASLQELHSSIMQGIVRSINRRFPSLVREPKQNIA